jgi:hypothetical protein
VVWKTDFRILSCRVCGAVKESFDERRERLFGALAEFQLAGAGPPPRRRELALTSVAFPW